MVQIYLVFVILSKNCTLRLMVWIIVFSREWV